LPLIYGEAEKFTHFIPFYYPFEANFALIIEFLVFAGELV